MRYCGLIFHGPVQMYFRCQDSVIHCTVTTVKDFLSAPRIKWQLILAAELTTPQVVFQLISLIRLSGFRLSGHVMELIQTTDEFHCGLRCLRNQHCRSYNSKDTGDNIYGKTICQLNNQTRLTAPDFFKPTPGFTYFEKGNTLRKGDADRNSLSQLRIGHHVGLQFKPRLGWTKTKILK